MPASAGGPLTAAQLSHFRVEGYVVLAGLVDLPSIERWRDDYWALLRTAVPRLDPNDDRTWPEDKSVFPALYGDRPTSDPRNGQRALYNFPLGSHPAVLAVVEQLGAGQLAETTSAESSCMLVWPRPDDESVATRPPPSSSDVAADRDAEGEAGRMHPATRGVEALGTGHLDDYNNSWGWGGGFFLGITTCLTDVDRDGGGFTLFPRSHRAFHRYFRRHPERVDGSYNDHLLRGTPRGGFQHIFDAAMSDPVDPVRVGSPLQFCGRAGDTILWHGWLAHDMGVRTSDATSPDSLRSQGGITSGCSGRTTASSRRTVAETVGRGRCATVCQRNSSSGGRRSAAAAVACQCQC